ncbi:MAG: hypothetical protein DRH17_14040 [Deltaproteobacteria bacterium]|nr:MAG: hypothetical protein DRH17_14040 [Deltaproteobacteria bacterium]
MPGKYLIAGDSYNDKIAKLLGFSTTLVDSFPTPGNVISALDFRSPDLLSADSNVDTIYIHRGTSENIVASFPAPNGEPKGLAWDGANLISCDASTDTIYKHDGLTETIIDSFPSPASFPYGLAWDGSNLLSADYSSDRVYKHSGFSSTIVDSLSIDSVNGISWDGSNLLTVEAYKIIRRYQGFSTTSTDTIDADDIFPSADVTDIAWIYSTVVTYVYHGDPPVGKAVDRVRFKTSDDSDLDYNHTLKIPRSGSYYSYWKHVAPYATEAPANFINNVKFYLREPFDWPGCTLRVAQVTNYDQATGTPDLTGAEASANHVDNPTMVDANNYTESSPLSLSGSLSGGQTGKIIDGYLLMQIEITPSATEGIQPDIVAVWEYDEG